MKKLERLIRLELMNFPGWVFLGQRRSHYMVSNGVHKIPCACSPKQNQTVLKNLRQKIRRIEERGFDPRHREAPE